MAHIDAAAAAAKATRTKNAEAKASPAAPAAPAAPIDAGRLDGVVILDDVIEEAILIAQANTQRARRHQETAEARAAELSIQLALMEQRAAVAEQRAAVAEADAATLRASIKPVKRAKRETAPA